MIGIVKRRGLIGSYYVVTFFLRIKERESPEGRSTNSSYSHHTRRTMPRSCKGMRAVSRSQEER